MASSRGQHASTKSISGIKCHCHVNRSSFPHPNAQIVRINTIGKHTELFTTMSRLPINYHCHQSVVVDNGLVEYRVAQRGLKDDCCGTSSDNVQSGTQLIETIDSTHVAVVFVHRFRYFNSTTVHHFRHGLVVIWGFFLVLRFVENIQ